MRLDIDAESVDAVDGLLKFVGPLVLLRVLQTLGAERAQQQSKKQIEHLSIRHRLTDHPRSRMYACMSVCLSHIYLDIGCTFSLSRYIFTGYGPTIMGYNHHPGQLSLTSLRGR